jgi:murein DD-endopeptidase MepM/ murein hydrolase activator NlpD
MNRRFPAALGVVLLSGGVALGVVSHRLRDARRRFEKEATLAGDAGRNVARMAGQGVLFYTSARIAAGSTLGRALAGMGVPPQLVAAITESAGSVFDLRQIRAGNSLEIGRSAEGQLRAVRYRIDDDRVLAVRASGDGFAADVQAVPTQIKDVNVSGQVRDSLFNAVADAGEDPELAMRLADIFGWDLDFYTDTRQGDAFRVLVEKKIHPDGTGQSYGRILAAEYDNNGRPYQAVLFHNASGAAAYYSATGDSLQKAFLRSPLKFAAPITSHFSEARFHPILKRTMPHLGVDYAAPSGTPVQAIGDGRVMFAGRKGGDGNMVEIQHANGYQTMYMHLSAILVRQGQHVEAGGRIGLVGSTGLATGPHLDFRIIDHGVFRNFETLRQNLPSAEPVAPSDAVEFASVRDQALSGLGGGALESRRVADASAPAAGAR